MDKDELLNWGIEEEICDRILEKADLMKEKYEREMESFKREKEIEAALYESGAKNIKAVRALIEEEGSVEEQLEKLKRDSATSFLFENSRGSFKPGKSSERLPNTEKDSFELRLSEARKRGDGIAAIKIKKQAAREGIVLL